MAEPQNPAKMILKRVIRGYKNNLEVKLWERKKIQNSQKVQIT